MTTTTTTTVPPTTTTASPTTTTTTVPPTTTTTEAPPTTTTVPDDSGDPQGDPGPDTNDNEVTQLAVTGAEVDRTALLGSVVTALGMLFMAVARRLSEPEWY